MISISDYMPYKSTYSGPTETVPSFPLFLASSFTSALVLLSRYGAMIRFSESAICSPSRLSPAKPSSDSAYFHRIKHDQARSWPLGK